MNKIKSIKILVHEGEESYVKSYVEYDENGNETRKDIYVGPEMLETKTLCRYNEKGLLIEEINFGEDNEKTDRTTIERDDEGKPLQTIITYADSSKTIKSYLRDDNEKSVTITEESDEGEFESMDTIFLDKKGNVIKRISYNEDENIIEQNQFEYNENNDVLKEISFQGEIKVSETHFFYDENKNLLKRIIINNEGETIDWALYKYNENGKNIEQQYGDHTLYKMEYNEKGLLVKEQKVNSMGIVDYSKTYSYNDADLLIEEDDLASKTTYEYEFY